MMTINMTNKISSTLVSILITIVPIMLALVPANFVTENGVDICELTDYQAANIRSAMLNSNTSCFYNMTVASVIN
eukprot:SAG22_NODE_16_length_32723_cov_26.404825_41_plen_75_part_00